LKKVFESIENIFKIPDLRKKLLFTLFIFFVYRLGGHIPLPGINLKALQSFFAAQTAGAGGLFALYDLFVGGAFRRATIFAVGIMPYISASIILQLVGAVVPYFQRLQKEGEEGRRKITQYTRYGTLIISALQGWGITVYLESLQSPMGPVVINPGFGFKFLAILALTTGGALIMWLGELITEKGIGNGMSLLIFIGIVARLPDLLLQEIALFRSGASSITDELILIVGALAFIVAGILLTQGTRKIQVQYASKVVGRKVYGGQATYLPLKINAAGVIPIIFAQSIVTFIPSTLMAIAPNSAFADTMNRVLSTTGVFYNVLYAIAIIFFCFFYTAIIFNPVDIAENLQKYGGYIPGRRPGAQTSEFIDRVLTRITFPGAIGLTLLAILPEFIIPQKAFGYYLGGTSLLIIIGVALDTLSQVETQLVMRHYEGFLKKGHIRGRRG
jgi:preprotein translocase subunit SecY